MQEFLLSTSFTGTWFFSCLWRKLEKVRLILVTVSSGDSPAPTLVPPLVLAGQFLCSGDQGRDPREKELCSAGMGQGGAAAPLGGERAGTACQGFLHCPGDGAVGMCPVLLGFLLPFLVKAVGH